MGIFVKRVVVYVTMILIIHGERIASTITIAIIFGTKTSVISWICVAAWKMLTIKPTIRDTSNIGDIIITEYFRRSLNI